MTLYRALGQRIGSGVAIKEITVIVQRPPPIFLCSVCVGLGEGNLNWPRMKILMYLLLPT